RTETMLRASALSTLAKNVRIESSKAANKARPHGLRKAAARRLAEAGCTAHEIGAITGHASLAELVWYTRAADQRRLAEAAMAKTRKSSGKPGQKFANQAENILKIKGQK